MRKIVSVLTFAIAFVVASAGVWAVFSAQAANQGNKITAGTLKIEADSSPDIPGMQNTALFDLSGLKPGDVTLKKITLINTGSLPLRYNGSAVLTTGDDNLFSSLHLKVGTTEGNNDLYDGSMKLFTGFVGGTRQLNSSQSEILYFNVSLPIDLDGTLEGKSASVSFYFNASQVP